MTCNFYRSTFLSYLGNFSVILNSFSQIRKMLANSCWPVGLLLHPDQSRWEYWPLPKVSGSWLAWAYLFYPPKHSVVVNLLWLQLLWRETSLLFLKPSCAHYSAKQIWSLQFASSIIRRTKCVIKCPLCYLFTLTASNSLNCIGR